MSFVVERKEAWYAEDFQEVLGPACGEDADEAFAALDQDGNSAISLVEMVMKPSKLVDKTWVNLWEIWIRFL